MEPFIYSRFNELYMKAGVIKMTCKNNKLLPTFKLLKDIPIGSGLLDLTTHSLVCRVEIHLFGY